MPFSEPAFAGLMERQGEEVHGVAFCMTKESGAELDRTEAGYNKQAVTLEAYDGRKLDGFVYMNKRPNENDGKPSKRYLGVLVKGARQAGLKEKYIKKLEAREPVKPPQWIFDLRKLQRLEDVSGMKLFTKEELAASKSDNDNVLLSVLGYVVKPKSVWFGSHKGRDLTSRMLMQYHGIPMDDNDDAGMPPYPLVKDLTEGEIEYLNSWLDHYQAAKSSDGIENVAEVLGFHKDFKEQQDSGKSDFKLPEIPQ